MKKNDVAFLKDVFLSDLDTGEKARIVKVEGAESGHDHLRVFTQSAEQKENGVVTLFKIFSEEVDAAEHCLHTDPPSALVSGAGSENSAGG